MGVVVPPLCTVIDASRPHAQSFSTCNNNNNNNNNNKMTLINQLQWAILQDRDEVK